MNKRMRRLLSLFLVLVMFVSAATPGFALGGDGDLDDGWDRDIDEGEVRDFDEDVPEDPEGPPTREMIFEDEETGLIVTVEVPEGTLPTLAELRVERVEAEDIREAVDEVVEGEPPILLALDIAFYLDDEQIEPDGPVQVKITAPELEGKTGLTLIHIPEEDEPEKVDMIPEDDLAFELGTNEIVFSSDAFSVYAVVDGTEPDENARLTINFYHHDDDIANDVDPVYTVKVTKRDVDILGNIIEDPNVPEVSGNELFCGWHVGTDYTAADVDGQHTIDFIRDYVKDYLNTHDVKEGDHIDVYAMVFHYFNVAYVDENMETTLATDVYYSKDATYEINVQLTYAPYEQGYRFQGWQKDDGDDTIYENGSTTTVTQPVTKIHAIVQKGYWLSFEENPGNHYSGASYVPPVFCPNGEIPADAMPDDPTLNGYTLGDSSGNKWFTTFTKGATAAEDVWANPFSFSGTLKQDTTVYAKWLLDDEVNYTIIVWRQSIDDDKSAVDTVPDPNPNNLKAKTYDYAFAVTKQVAPNTPVADLININTAGLAYYTTLSGKNISVDGVTQKFYGFTYNETKGVVSKDTVVKPDGTTVVNLYYDRDLITVTYMTEEYTAVSGHPSTYSGTPVYFIGTSDYGYCPIRYYDRSNNEIYIPTTSNSGTQYAVVNGVWYELVYRQNSNTGVYGWYYTSDNKYHKWDGTRYTYYGKGDTTSFTYYTCDWAQTAEWTGLYDQPVSKYNYTWSTEYRWMDGDPTSNSFVSLMDCFAFSVTLYGVKKEFNAYVYHFLQDENGDYETAESNADFTVRCNSNTDRMVFREFSGFNSDQYRVKLPSSVSTYYLSTNYTTTGSGNDAVYSFTWDSGHTATDYHDGAYWTDWIDNSVQVKYSGIDEPTDMKIKPAGGKIEFRYARIKKPISFMYGTFVTGRDVEMTAPYTGELKHTDPIFFGASVDSYKKNGGENYYDPVAAGDFTDSSFIFEGWYVDPGCTTPYDFAGKTMPQGGITVYAKFRQREYRVFLHVNEEGKQWSDVTWNDPDQASNFRIAYDDVISDGNPIEGTMEGYVLVGWYTDKDCTQPYNFSTRYTDASMANLAQEYGATQKADPEYATESDGTNKDVNRPWIDKMVHLYAKWRKVMPGSTGITLVYDAVEEAGVTGKTGTMIGATGSNVTQVTDPMRYTDNSDALSHSAATPDSNMHQFLYWEILDKNGEPSGEIVYPGMTFTVNADYAVVTDVEPASSGNAVQPVLPRENLYILKGGAQKAATTTYQEVTEPEVGHSYLMGYVSGSTVYLIGNGSYYQGGICPKSVTATVSSGEITGDYDAYLWTVTDNANQQLIFQNATAGYLGLAVDSDDYYAAFSSSNNTWTYTNNKLVNATSATNYKYLTYYSDYSAYDVANSGGSNITFFEEVVQGNPVTYTKVETPVPGISYVIAADGQDYAMSGSLINNNGETYLSGTEITRSGNTVTIYDSQAADLTWTAGGNATNGWTWQNVGNSNYLHITDGGYLTIRDTSSLWTYDSNKYFINQTTANANGWKYLTFSSDYADYDTAKSGSAIGIYALTHTLTINYVYADGTTAAETHVGLIPEGVDYTVESPVIDGYNVDQATVTGAMGTSDVTVTVTYTPAAHTVTFQNWDGTVLKTETVAHGGHATAPTENPTRQGYNFTGWDPDPVTTEITEDLIITAQYTREGYFMVVFKDWNGRVLKEEEVERGRNATPPADPEREGFTFNRWDKDYTNVQSDLVIYATYSTKVTKVYTVTLRAHYGPRVQQEQTHITWYANNGTGDYMNSEGVYMNENIQIPIPAADHPTSQKTEKYIAWNSNNGTRDLVWEDHVFLGWARVNESDMDGDPYWSNPANHPEEIELGEANLFLKYDPTTGTFKANNSIVSYEDRPKLSKDYAICGSINGQDYSFDDHGPEFSDYKFNEYGEYPVTFTQDSYIFVKTADNSEWYMTDGWNETATSVTLYKTGDHNFQNGENKLKVPGNVPVTLILNENKDGTLTLSYRRSGTVAGTNGVDDGTRAPGEGNWVDVDYVAADELKAYHAMYAVWGKVIYVYHSGTGVVEKVVVDPTKKLDVASRTSPGYLYGGYYKAYAGQSENFDVKSSSLEWLTPSETQVNSMCADAQAEVSKGWLTITTDAGCTKYTGTTKTDGNTVPVFDYANAYSLENEGETDGMHVVPTAGTTYYIKEVPAEKYLQPYFHFTYRKNSDENLQVLRSAWLISAIDDSNYNETGFVIRTHDKDAFVCSTLTVENAVGGAKVTLKPESIFRKNGVMGGYLSYLEVMNNGEFTNEMGTGVIVGQYWITPDGLVVTGTSVRTYSNLSTRTAAKSGVVTQTVTSTITVYDEP